MQDEPYIYLLKPFYALAIARSLTRCCSRALWLADPGDPMVAPISDDVAQRFAEALITHSGNQSAAAVACGYTPGNIARSRGRDLARNPRVLKILQPLVMQHISALTPKAVQTLSGLLTAKSSYIRLEAAKDILNRTGVGVDQQPLRAQPLLIRINLGTGQQGHSADTNPVVIENTEQHQSLSLQDPMIDNHGTVQETPAAQGQVRHGDAEAAAAQGQLSNGLEKEPGGPKREQLLLRASPAHDFSSEVPAHDFSPKVSAASVSKPLELDDEVEASEARPQGPRQKVFGTTDGLDL
jgi:hypothetical protein